MGGCGEHGFGKRTQGGGGGYEISVKCMPLGIKAHCAN